ncbi:MAG: flagellin, partial [Burkholderiaceae bacterium]|nr:flagellin [Burkholderiaceae bacterium]
MPGINNSMNVQHATRHLNRTQEMLANATEELASGRRINRAKDDAAGLAIAAGLTTQISGMNQAERNAYDGVSMAQTAEKALSVYSDSLQRIRELAVQASNITLSPDALRVIQGEVNQLLTGLNDVANSTTFNGQNLLDGTMAAQTFQVGPDAGDTVTVGGTDFRTNAYGNNRLESSAVQPGTTVAASTLTVSGSAGSATVAVDAGASAADVAAAINAQSGNTGVTASATTEVNLGNLQPSQDYAFELTSGNAQPVTVAFSVGADGDLASAVEAFNQQSAKTGVTAQTDAVTGGIKLTNAAGDIVGLQAKPGSNLTSTMREYDAEGNLSAAATVTDAGVTEAAGTLTLNSPEAFSVTESTPMNGIALSGPSRLDTVGSISLQSFEDAQRA